MATAEQIIISHRNKPLDLSVADVTQALCAGTVIVVSYDRRPPGPGVFDGKTSLTFGGAADKLGRIWAYAYTSRAEFRRAFAGTQAGTEMRFVDLFPLIDREARIAGGIFLNAGSEAEYPMPRDLFPVVRGLLGRPIVDNPSMQRAGAAGMLSRIRKWLGRGPGR